ncbi:hypothetical protein TNCV_2855161 [Trichonephila clavipes]|nr:hypothetical protein TNCV_2855161 [Trichonephila clavipes]
MKGVEASLPEAALQNEHLVPTVKHGGGEIMFCRCMEINGVGKVEYIESIVNKYDYLDVLKNNLKESATKLAIQSSFRFQHNNSKHTTEALALV